MGLPEAPSDSPYIDRDDLLSTAQKGITLKTLNLITCFVSHGLQANFDLTQQHLL